MSDDSNLDWLRIARHLAEEDPPESRAETVRWIHASHGRSQVVANLRRIWTAVPEHGSKPVDAAQLWAEHARRWNPQPVQQGDDPTLVAYFPSRSWYRVGGMAAVGCLLAVLSIVGLRTLIRLDTSHAVSYVTGNGQHATVILPDNSQLVLNVGSRITIPSGFGRDHRTVDIAGEALFTVANHRDLPFIVKAGDIHTRVLGTTFAVRRYSTDATTFIAVRDGKVSVESSYRNGNNASSVVVANQQAEFHRDGGFAVRAGDTTRFLFAERTLVFDGIELRDAIPDINRWYNTTISVDDPALLDRPIKLTLDGKSLSQLSEILGLMLDVQIVREGKSMTLISRR